MPRYFFHLHEDAAVIDDLEGAVHPSLAAARAMAVRAARDIMSAEVKTGHLRLADCIVIEDHACREVARILFREAIEVDGL